MAFGKYVRRYGRKVARAVRKRYTTKGGKFNLKRVVKDVQMIKQVLNPEKKRFVINNTSNTAVGQVNGNASGFLVLDVTPTPAVGIGYAQRNGASIKVHSSYFQFQLYDQIATNHPMKIKFMLCEVKGNPQTPSTAVAQMITPNPFLNPGTTPIYDYNSALNPDYLKQYRCIRTWRSYLAPDNVSGQRIVKDVKIGIKYRNFHTRFSQDTQTVSAGQLILIVLCDSGNMSASTACTIANVPVTPVNTGMSLNYNLLHYYYDN